MADEVAVRAALLAVLRAELRVLRALVRAVLPWRVAAPFLAVARRWVSVWLLRALVLRARVVLLLRVLLERVEPRLSLVSLLTLSSLVRV